MFWEARRSKCPESLISLQFPPRFSVAKCVLEQPLERSGVWRDNCCKLISLNVGRSSRWGMLRYISRWGVGPICDCFQRGCWDGVWLRKRSCAGSYLGLDLSPGLPHMAKFNWMCPVFDLARVLGLIIEDEIQLFHIRLCFPRSLWNVVNSFASSQVWVQFS